MFHASPGVKSLYSKHYSRNMGFPQRRYRSELIRSSPKGSEIRELFDGTFLPFRRSRQSGEPGHPVSGCAGPTETQENEAQENMEWGCPDHSSLLNIYRYCGAM